jgi:EAL domain-containing protein (putative c-di-GMP-specific phosphodiesterase class I)
VTFSEAIGLSEELDGAVLERAVAVLADAPRPPVAVNISGLSMQSPVFRERMLGLAGIRPGRFLIELTETAQIEDVAGAAATLDKLRAAGIPVCIDDFGAGAAAFRYLREFRVDYLKLDGPYIQRAPRNRHDRHFVASMVSLARSVGVQVIAEMIETEEQARLMREMGVDLGQGWLFGPGAALPTEDPGRT